MHFEAASYSRTLPLDYANKVDNKIYDPNVSEIRTPKRTKSNAFPNLFVGLSPRTPSRGCSHRKKRYNSFISPRRVSQWDSDLSLSSSLSSDNSDSELDGASPPDTPETTLCDSPVVKLSGNVFLQDTKPIYEQSANQASIFEIPELVHKIVEYVDAQSTVIPTEASTIRRRPLSLRHSMLIHGDQQLAESHFNDNNNISPVRQGGSLYQCLQISRMFNEVTKQVMNKKILFNDQEKFCQFLKSDAPSGLQPTVFVLHKLFQMKQKSIDMIKHRVDFSKLEWLEFYMCPKLFPTSEFFVNGGNIKKIVVTGSNLFDDLHLFMISKYCPNLEVLDIRACEFVTDAGLYHIAQGCKKLVSINFGRKKNGHLVTDHSMISMTSNNKNLNTVGLAGCHISDRVIWNLAIGNSNSLKRLSINNCPYITDNSIPIILENNYFLNLTVLELRFVNSITNFRPIIQFKRRQEYRGIAVLIETCEELCLRLREQELEVDHKISQKIFTDIIDWFNKVDDGDMPFQTLLEQRRLQVMS